MRKKDLYTPEQIAKEIARLDRKICCSLEAILAQAAGNIYTVNGSLIGDRVMDLNSMSLAIEENSTQLFLLDPDNFDAVLVATDGLNGTSTLSLSGDALGSNVSALLQAQLVGTIASINVSATNDLIEHNANKHQINVDGNVYLELDGSLLSSIISATDVTSQTSLQLTANSVGNDVKFILKADNGTNVLTIVADASTNSIIHTADEHTFDGEISATVSTQEIFKASLGNSYIRAWNDQDDDNSAFFEAYTNNTEAGFQSHAIFNNGVKLASIVGLSDASSSSITHTADTHTFSVSGSFAVDGGQTGMALDSANNQAIVAAGDGTGNADLTLVGGAGGNYTFTLEADDNVNQVTIFGDAVAESITYTAIHHNFPGLQDFADDAAAAVGGLAIGDLYRTASVVKVRVA